MSQANPIKTLPPDGATTSSDSVFPTDSVSPTDSRRSFVTKVAAIVTGGIAMLVPLTSGLVVFLSPLWRKTKSPQVRVALLSQVPEDGTPHFFPVSADRTDAWNRYPQQRIGGVYLLREKNQDQNKSGQKPIALTAKCPHAGCFIGYAPGADAFRCPCHTSTFHLDGARVHGDAEVSPRDMDRLPVELRPVGTELSRAVDSNEAIQVASTADLSNVRDAEIWVEYIEFQTGHKQQIRAV